MDRSINNIRGVRLDIFYVFVLETHSNREILDQTPQHAATSDLGLHAATSDLGLLCLSVALLWDNMH